MNWREGLDRISAVRTRAESPARRRIKEIEASIRAHAANAAALEVEAHERLIEELVSVHKETGDTFPWENFLKIIEPFPPMVAPPPLSGEQITPKSMRSLSRRVVLGEVGGYAEALKNLSPFSSIQHLGTTVEFEVVSRELVICQLAVNDRNIIPRESKTLTASGKVSTKAMAKGRYHELYQDHVCSCAIRVAREIHALLPVEAVIVTTLVRAIDPRTGNDTAFPVLSAAMTREQLRPLDFERLDPSDSMENFVHRGDVLASKRTGEFKAIVPLGSEDIIPSRSSGRVLGELTKTVNLLRNEIQTLSARVSSHGSTAQKS